MKIKSRKVDRISSSIQLLVHNTLQDISTLTLHCRHNLKPTSQPALPAKSPLGKTLPTLRSTKTLKPFWRHSKV